MTASTPEGTPVAGPQTPGPAPPPSGAPPAASSRPAVPPGDPPTAWCPPRAPPGAARWGRGKIDAILGARPALRPTLLEALRAIEAQGDFLALGPEQQDDALRAAERASRGAFPGPRAPGLQRLLLPSRRAPRRRLRPAVRPAVRSAGRVPSDPRTPFDESPGRGAPAGRSGARLESGLLTSAALY